MCDAADQAFAGGWLKSKSETGLRAMARVYAGWGFSQTFYRQKLDLSAPGYSSLEDFLVAFWGGFLRSKDVSTPLGR